MQVSMMPLRTSNKTTMFLYYLMREGVDPNLMMRIIDEKGFERGSMEGEHDLFIGGLATIAQDIARLLTGEDLVKVTGPQAYLPEEPTEG